MRPSEIPLLVLALLWIVSSLLWPHARRAEWLLGGSVLFVLGLHLSLEGARAQMVPAYFLPGVALISRRVRTLRRRLLLAALIAPLALVAVALPSVFPVFEYARPTGPHAIGTAYYPLPGRAPGRDLMAQVWYPALPGTRGRTASITSHPQLLADAYASFTGLPRVLFDHLRLVRTHAFENARLAGDERFPVVLFSHGPLGANRSQSIFQMEALASRGFVVVAIDHTGYASTTIFPDGHTVPPGPEAAWPVFVDEKSTAMVKTWVADVRFVIDRLEELNQRDPHGLLQGRLDLSRMGYLGASFGGSVVVQALLDEPRIKAGIAQDGKAYFFDDALSRLERPLMYMQSSAPYMKSTDAELARWNLTQSSFKLAEQDHQARLMRLLAAARGPIYDVFIRGTDHVTFSDLYLIVAIPDAKRMEIRRAHRIINDYTIAFFERYLNGVDAPLVTGGSAPDADVTVSKRNLGSPGDRS